jgi:hypothetical protein
MDTTTGPAEASGAAQTTAASDGAAQGGGAASYPAEPLSAAPLAFGADLAAEYEARVLNRVQGLQAKFANMRAHLLHGVNGDVRAVAHALTALVDLLEEELTADLHR